jgi:hypothetical protein
MSEPSSPKYQFPGDIDRTQLHTEQQLDPMINRQMYMPNPLDPMGQIETDGRALRNLAQRRMPTWVIMISWATIGLSNFLFCSFLLRICIQEATIALHQKNNDRLWMSLGAVLPQLVFSGLIAIVLCRATWRRR